MSAESYQSGFNIRCAGGNDGKIKVSFDGGVSPFNVLWNDGQSGNSRDGLSAGIYWIVATDSVGNVSNDTITLIEPTLLQTTAEKKQYSEQFHISKTNARDGQLIVNVSGGTAPYSVVWNDSTFGSNKLNLDAGQYVYKVSDANGCEILKQELLNEPTELTVQIQILSEVSCANSSDGKAQVNINGGVPPYDVQWSSGETGIIAEALEGVRSFVKVRDRHNAEVVLPVDFTVPPKLYENVIVSQYPGGFQVSCADCFNGSIELEVIGGIPPYTVTWSDTSNLADPFHRQNLGGRFYQYSITDANQCKLKGYTELTEPKLRGWQLNGNTEVDPDVQYLGTNDSSSFVIKTNSALALKINGDGNLGVGAEPTTAKLSVNGDVLGNAGLKLPFLNIYNDTASSSLQNFRLIAIDENGNIAKLGNNFPVQGLLPQEQRCKLTQQNEYIAQWAYVLGSPSLATIGTDDCRPFVGIGTISPQTRLDVNGNSFIRGGLQVRGEYNLQVLDNFPVYLNAATKIESYGSNSLFVSNIQTNDFGHAAVIEVNRAATKAFSINETSNNTSETFVVYGDGTTIIGGSSNSTIVPSNETKLAVYGLISANEVLVKVDDFPDYVFEDDYCLEDIESVAEYIEVNKHLPGVKSRTEVLNQGGVELGDMQIAAMEKIEELYLYVIQLNERIKALERENEALKHIQK
jgi:hypothetical protein